MLRSDVKGYYANMDQTILIEQLEEHVRERDVMRLLNQVIQRTVEWGGTFKHIYRGIGRGGRSGQIIYSGSAGPDHPLHISLSEISYLKTLVFRLQ